MIRIARESDIPKMIEIYAPYVLRTTHTFEYTVPTFEAFTQRFQSITAQFPWIVWEEDGQVLGYAYGSAPFERAAYAWCGEVSIYLAPEIHKRGIGRQLYEVLEAIMQKQGYLVIYALVTTENTGSLAFHKKLGYRQTAVLPDCGIKFGRQLGIVWLEKRFPVKSIPTQNPRPWNDFVRCYKSRF